MQVCVLFIGVMATVIPPSAKKLTSSKSEIQISYDGSSSLRSKGRQLPRAPSTPDDLASKETVLLRHPLPKYSFQATKRKVKTDGKKNEVKKSEEKDRNDNVPLPVGTVKPVSKVEPYLDQDEFSQQNQTPQIEAPKLEMVLRTDSTLDWPNSDEEVKKLKEEVTRLKGELDVQYKVRICIFYL